MKKVLLSAAALVVIAFSTKAQDKKDAEGFHFGAGINVSIPVGDLGDVAGVGFGPRIQGEYRASEHFSVLGSLSYNFFSKKNEVSVTTLPVQAGARFYTSSGFFLGAELGYMNVHTKITGFGSASGGAFSYHPHIGYDLEHVQFTLGYQAASKDGSTTSYVGVGGVYKF
jgi:hypothetical protein